MSKNQIIIHLIGLVYLYLNFYIIHSFSIVKVVKSEKDLILVPILIIIAYALLLFSIGKVSIMGDFLKDIYLH